MSAKRRSGLIALFRVGVFQNGIIMVANLNPRAARPGVSWRERFHERQPPERFRGRW